jgi:hypothetical protein
MKIFNVGVVLVLILMALGGYWFLNPHRAPAFLRYALPDVELQGPTTPLPNWR